jgi:hypothetical protein
LAAILGRPETSPPQGMRAAFVSALVIWGVAVVAGLEVLSPFHAIRQAPLALLWTAVTASAFLLGGGAPGLRRALLRLAAASRSLGAGETAFVVALALLFGLLFATAVVSPPNNVDSLNVHMPRVVHWAQNHSLADYFASARGQLTRPPFAEAAMLNLRTLFGGDRPAALVQWFSLLSGVIVASLVAARLGAGRPGQMVTAAYAASIPLAVLMATNTKNDLVVSLWVVCVAYYAVLSARRRLATQEVVLAGAAVGLGLLTKGTFQPAAFPFVCWLAVNLLRKSRWRASLVALALFGGLAVLLNLGYWARNVRSFGTPYGTLAGLAQALEIDDLLPGLPAGAAAEPTPGAQPGPPLPAVAENQPDAAPPRLWPFLSRAASLLTLHTIYPEVGAPTRAELARLPGVFEPGFLVSLEEGLWNHEDSAGALLHVLLAMAASLWAVARSIRTRDGILAGFVVSTWFGWSLLTLITNSIQLWGIRYQLGFLLLSAVVVGVVAGWIRRELTYGLAVLLLLAAIPYALLNNTRPLVGAPPRTRTESIFLTPAVDLLFTSTPEVEAQYAYAAEWLEGSACRQIGLDLGGRDLEYTLWWLLGAPQSGFRLEVLRGFEGARELLDSGFRPCAVLCTRCGEQDRYLGLPMQFDGGFLRLFAADGA